MSRLMALGLAAAALAAAQAPQTLTLQQAEQIALREHPAIRSAQFSAEAARQVTVETRAASLPFLAGNLTTAAAADRSRIAAGALNNPVIYNRAASGLTLGQLITDFGRNSSLTESARLRAQAFSQSAAATRARVVLDVDRSYFATLKAQKVLDVSRQTLKARQLVYEQVSTLARNKLKSELDVSFAGVAVSEAKLLIASAQNDLDSALAALNAAMGRPAGDKYELAEEPMGSDLPQDLAALLDEAVRKRPELAALRLEENSAQRLAQAEKALKYPTISTIAAIGFTPLRQDALTSKYGAVGLNVQIPILNGKLFGARQAEAELRARAAQENIRDFQTSLVRDVRIAWLNARTALERLSLTEELVHQARLSLDLAQARYDLGLGSIVELSQAQLAQTSAEIAGAGARYDYQAQRSVLRYQIGSIF
jgi:outer membrane protein